MRKFKIVGKDSKDVNHYLLRNIQSIDKNQEFDECMASQNFAYTVATVFVLEEN